MELSSRMGFPCATGVALLIIGGPSHFSSCCDLPVRILDRARSTWCFNCPGTGKRSSGGILVRIRDGKLAVSSQGRVSVRSDVRIIQEWN